MKHLKYFDLTFYLHILWLQIQSNLNGELASAREDLEKVVIESSQTTTTMKDKVCTVECIVSLYTIKFIWMY